MLPEFKTPLLPRIFPFLTWWPEVNKSTMRSDLLAGLTGAVIVLPQGVAFAMIAGLPPIYGLYTAMVTPVVAALFGSSKHLVSGPNTPISLLIFAVVSQMAEPASDNYIRLVLTITLLAGIFQLVFGLARMGSLVNFVSHVVVAGFTAGAAILIMQSQVKHLLGIEIPSGDSFLHTLFSIGEHLYQTNYFALATGLLTLAAALLSKKFLPRLPNMLVALVAGTLFALALGGEQVGIKMVGDMPGRLPSLSAPDFSFAKISSLAPMALAVAVLGLIQSTSIAKTIAFQSKQQIDANQEFIGQGLSNIVGSFFSSYAGAGSFTRSGINYEAGAKTPLAIIFASLLLMVIVLFIAPYIAYLPVPAMAGVIMLVGYALIDFRFSRTVLRASKRQTSVLVVTFVSTLFLDLEYAVYLGVLFSLIFYLQKTSTPHVATMAPDPDVPGRRFRFIERKALAECPQMKMLRVDGSIFFGSVGHISSEIRRLTDEAGPHAKHLLILSKGINFIDVAGSEWLAQEAQRWKEKGGGLYMSGLKIVAQDSLVRGGFKKEIGEENFFTTKEEALQAITKRLDMNVCAACTSRIFLECEKLPGPETLKKEPSFEKA